MARGKHKNAAEARRVREQAEAAAESQAKRADRLERELVETQGRLNVVLESMHTETTRLRLIIAAGETEATEELHGRVRDLEERLTNARQDVGLAVLALMREHVNVHTADFRLALADLTGLPVTAVLPSMSERRSSRRMTTAKMRAGKEGAAQAAARGLSLMPAGHESNVRAVAQLAGVLGEDPPPRP